MTNTTTITIGPKGGVLHVNRQFIAQNAKDGRNRPVFTLKPNGPSSKAVYARDLVWDGPTSARGTAGQLACGARAWISIAAGTTVILEDRMSYKEAKAG
ncbi:hypothetical protein [Erythrobacter phage vB_EliS-L02]|nr:hypothetical protein [Erythrobacter phage vB_EliS-L02]